MCDIEHQGFECGYATVGYETVHPCPADPQFPSIDDYELVFKKLDESGPMAWECTARAKTEMAHKVTVLSGYGATKEEAEARLRESFPKARPRRSA
jgi:hypothetical protein